MFAPLTSQPKRRKHLAIDTLQARDGRLVAVGILDQAGRFEVHTRRDEAVTALGIRSRRGVVYWVHGLDRVAGGLFGRGLPPGLQLAASRSGLVCGRWRDGQPLKDGKRRRITRKLWDLGRHYADTSWAELARMTGMEVPEWIPPATWQPRPTEEDAAWARQVVEARCRCVMRAVEDLERFYLSHGTETTPSVASSAIRAWRRNDQPTFKFDRWIPPQPWKLAWMRGALYGGRAEAYQLGDLAGPLETWDVASQYPYLCTTTRLPCVSEPWTWIRQGEPRGWRDRPSIIEATVSVPDMPLPPLPHRRPSDGHTIYPTGIFRGRWHGSELHMAEGLGVRILEVHAGLAFSSSDYYLRAHAERFWKIKSAAPHGSAEYHHAKAMANAVIGKWGQRPGIIEVLSPDEAETWRRAERMRLILAERAGLQQVPRTLAQWPPMARDPVLYVTDDVEGEGVPPSHVNVFWTGEIYAQARMMLLRAAISNWRGLAMMDTDSLTGRAVEVQRSAPKTLGAWELEASWDELRVRAPKVYSGIVDGRLVATVAGIGGDDESARLRYVDQGSTRIERQAGYMESLHRGFYPGQIMQEFKRMKQEYDRRQWSDMEQRWMPLHVSGDVDRWIIEEES